MSRELIRLTQKLIRIDSQNPPGKEREIALFIKGYLKNLRLTCRIYEFKKDRLNVVCKIPSLKNKKSIVFVPHLDTVPVSGTWRFGPFSGKIFKDKIYGRGASDCKSNVGVAMYLIKRLKEENIRLNNLDLIFAFSADEETGSNFGIKALLKQLKGIHYGVVLDASDFNIIVAQKGLLHLRVEVLGKEAHGAFPERGINAIEKSIYALRDILQTDFSYKPHCLLNRPTLNIGRFSGGDKVNIVAGYAFFELDIRYLPSMEKKEIIKDIEKLLKKHIEKYKVTILASQPPIEIDKNNFLIKILEQTLKNHNIKPCLKPSFGATVINFLKDEGIESFAFGFGTEGCAHTKNEYVKIKNLYKGVDVLKDYIVSLDKYLERV